MSSQRGCSGACVNRRGFLAGAAVSGAALAWMPQCIWGASPAADRAKARIRLVFSHHHEDKQGKQSEQGWPYLGYDHEKKRKEVLAKLKASCPNVEFLPAVAFSVADAQKILEEDKSQSIDGYLAYMLGGWAQAGQTFAHAGKPTIYVGDLYGASGELLMAIAEANRNPKLKAFGVTSSRFDDVVEAVRCFECLKKLKSSVILDVGAAPGELGKAIRKEFGTKVDELSFDQLHEAYEKADRIQAAQLAKKWIDGAQKIGEPTAQEIEKSAAMYLGMRSLMDERCAQAITINCLGGFYSGKMGAYPCLGHFHLNNSGLVGACEADLQSTITMLLMGYLVGRPGYISDPVVDTATKRIIYLHCVAPSRAFGPAGPANPYEILSHAEDRKGAAVRSLMPVGHVVTTLKFSPTTRQVIVHQGKTVGNVDDDRSCRTKLAAEVIGDVEKLLAQWDQWGWHRVTFYGDYKRTLRQISALLGFQVVEEA
jgi:L-fucose isomerase-like protein